MVLAVIVIMVTAAVVVDGNATDVVSGGADSGDDMNDDVGALFLR